MTTGRRTSNARARAACKAVGVGLLTLIAAGAVRAQVPGTMNFQGLLLDAEGQPKNGTVTLGFALYAEASGGSPLWTETLADIPVTDGVYDVVLGATSPLTPEIFSSATRYLQMTIDGEVLAPRRQLLVVPYAIRAAAADTAITAENATTANNASIAATADTAAALAANGANCPAGQVPQGVNASGGVEGCITPLQSLGQDITPILGGDLDANGNALSDIDGVALRDVSRAATRPTAYWELDQAELGTGWKWGAQSGDLYWSPLGYDAVSGRTWNCTASSCGADNPFGPAVQINEEPVYVPAGAGPDGATSAPHPLFENNFNYFRPRGTWNVDSASGTLDENETFIVRKATGDQHVVGAGRVVSYAPPTLTMDWYPITDKSDPPTANDILEAASSTTVTSRTGTFPDGSVGVVLSSGAACPANVDAARAAGLSVVTILDGNVGSDPNVLLLIQTLGPKSDLSSGNRICFSPNTSTFTANALLGTVTPTDTARLVGSYTSQMGVGANIARLGWQQGTDYFELKQDAVFVANQTDKAAGVFPLEIKTNASGMSWVGIFSGNRASWGPPFRFHVGDTTTPVTSTFYGPLQIYGGSGHYGLLERANLGASRTWTLPNATGTLLALDTTGCAPNDVLVYGATAGAVVCGAPMGSGNVVGPSVGTASGRTGTARTEVTGLSSVSIESEAITPTLETKTVARQDITRPPMLPGYGHSADAARPARFGHHAVGRAIAFEAGFTGSSRSTGDVVCQGHGWTAARWVEDCGTASVGGPVSCTWRAGDTTIKTGDEAIAHCE